MREIEAKHIPIAHMFGSGAGLRLMRRDSDMTERLLLRLVKRGVVVLPIHDSYIVPNRVADKGQLMEAMAYSLRQCVEKPQSINGFPKSLPQYGGGVGGGVGDVGGGGRSSGPSSGRLRCPPPGCCRLPCGVLSCVAATGLI